MNQQLISDIDLAPSGGFKGFGPLGLENVDPWFASIQLNKVISTAIGVMTIVAIIWFIIQLFLGAIAIVGSGGDKGKLTEARGKITSALMGLVVVIAAVFLIEVIGNILGIENILSPSILIQQIFTE